MSVVKKRTAPMKDSYYDRKEVSNSDLTALKMKLFPSLDFVSDKDRQKAFRLGTLVDALVTEPSKANAYRHTAGEYRYTADEWKWGEKMRAALQKRSEKDAFLAYVLANSDTQRSFANPAQEFDYGCFHFNLPTRCKFDWWLTTFGGDLKTVSADTEKQFRGCIDFFDWDRSRAWYMDLVHSINPAWGNMDFIYAVSKETQRVFFCKIERGDEIYKRGREKYLNLAFRMWMVI